jgi:hypothetical protein
MVHAGPPAQEMRQVQSIAAHSIFRQAAHPFLTQFTSRSIGCYVNLALRSRFLIALKKLSPVAALTPVRISTPGVSESRLSVISQMNDCSYATV